MSTPSVVIVDDHAKWGALNGVYVDNDGRSLWVVDRCGANPDVPAGQSPFQILANELGLGQPHNVR